MSESKRQRAEKTIQIYAALGVGFVCIVIGLPLWWKTTEVYRAHLPYQEIDSLTMTQVKCYVDFTLIVFNEDVNKQTLAAFGEKLKESFEKLNNTKHLLQVKYRGQIRERTEDEAKIYLQSENIYVLDNALGDVDASLQHGHVYFVLIPKDNRLKIKQPWIGRRRNVFVPTDNDFEKTIPSIVNILRDIIVSEATLFKTFHTAKGLLTQADKDSMRSLRSHPGYDVTFTLLNPEPNILLVNWDIKDAVQKYINPLLKAFDQFAEITVKSQYLHFTDLGVSPVKVDEASGYKLTQTQLPHIINPIEAYLSSHVSTNPNLNFVLYITPRSHYPLKIYDNADQPSSSNSFLSPRWGGILIYNIPTPENVSLPASVMVDMQYTMEVFLSQLRLLLGINLPQSQPDVTISQPGRAIISDWELDQWLRKLTVENIATSTSTLRSLAQLLEEISNIVINDDIAREVERAVTSIDKALSYLHQSKLREAFVFARQALLSSEKAFFDPSLLELLYFPEDQKFAIYIPLFLPISIPVILSVIKSVKVLMKHKKEKTE